MTTFQAFATWLQEQLTQRGWDQAELARRSGVTTAHISNIMAGERNVGAQVSRKIARALHLPPEQVFRQAGLLPKAMPHSAKADELLHLFEELNEDDKTRLLGIARTLRQIEDVG
ncbi:MAG: helix-turn-helix domain-containing protein [Armatimonadota bacterium]